MFAINNQRIKFRVAKITPKKLGQFVTLWKRIGGGDIMPHDMEDPIDLFIITVRDVATSGQFVFPKAVLWAKGIVSKDGKGGKRAMRLCPAWDKPDNAQAKNRKLCNLIVFLRYQCNVHLTHLKCGNSFTPLSNCLISLQV